MNKATVRRRAYDEAAGLLASDCDDADLSSDLNEEDEGKVREYMRTVIVPMLSKRAEVRK